MNGIANECLCDNILNWLNYLVINFCMQLSIKSGWKENTSGRAASADIINSSLRCVVCNVKGSLRNRLVSLCTSVALCCESHQKPCDLCCPPGRQKTGTAAATPPSSARLLSGQLSRSAPAIVEPLLFSNTVIHARPNIQTGVYIFLLNSV